MFSHDLIRTYIDEREREVEAALRVRRLLGDRRAMIRWRPRRPRPLGERETRQR